MKKISLTLISFILITLLIVPLNVQCIEGGGNNSALSMQAFNLKMAERKLWIDHVLWTRSFIISDLADVKDKDSVAQRLLKNQDDIGASIKPYYGEEAGNKLAELLKEHINIAGQVVDAAKSGNKDDFDKNNKLWHENADKIAKFLSSANPNLPEAKMKDMLYKHLDLIIQQVTARLNSDWQADIDAYDKGEDHMIMFADTISDAIIKQFAPKFK